MIFVIIAIEYQTPNEEKESVLMLLLVRRKRSVLLANIYLLNVL